MIRLTTKVGCLAAGALCAAGFIVWPGCATPPLPASRTPLSIHKRDEFSLKKNAHPSRDEIIARLGPPDECFEDLRVACYKLNELKRCKLWLFLGILPIAVTRDSDGLEFAMIQFDDHDQEQRVAIKIISEFYYGNYGPQGIGRETARRAMLSEAKKWVTTPTGGSDGR